MSQNDARLQIEQSAAAEPPTGATDTEEIPHCVSCGSDRVVRDAWATWNPKTQMWELQQVFDHTFCLACECDSRLDWKKPAVVQPRN